MTYVDGFVIPVPKSKVAEYRKMAAVGKKMWMKHGALQYFECLGDDLAGMPECGNFKTMAGLKPSETAFFSFIVYKNKAHRNAVNKKVMQSGPGRTRIGPPVGQTDVALSLTLDRAGPGRARDVVFLDPVNLPIKGEGTEQWPPLWN